MPYTKQKIFDTGVSFVLAQGGPAKVDDVSVYRGPDGIKCVIGACIPDGLYHEYMEGYRIADLIRYYTALQAVFSLDDIDFLKSLQNIHDHHDFETWPKRFKDFAWYHDLSSKVVDDYLAKQEEDAENAPV